MKLVPVLQPGHHGASGQTVQSHAATVRKQEPVLAVWRKGVVGHGPRMRLAARTIVQSGPWLWLSTENGRSGIRGRNAIVLAAEEYNDETEIAVIRLRKMADCGATETGRKFKSVQNGNVQILLARVRIGAISQPISPSASVLGKPSMAW